MAQKADTVPFPSDELCALLKKIQLVNSKVSRDELDNRHPETFRKTVRDAILMVLRSTVSVVERDHRATDFPLSIGDGFIIWFADRLTMNLMSSVTGFLNERDENTIVHMLYKELQPIGISQEIAESKYVFVFENDRYAIRSRFPIRQEDALAA